MKAKSFTRQFVPRTNLPDFEKGMLINMKKKEHIIDRVEAGSIAEELGVEKNDVLLEINGNTIQDVFDYQFLTVDEELEVLIRKPDGEEWLLDIEKEYGEDLGLIFENGLMDDYKTCRNNCVFCFIDQMPKGMRDTLYFKDDDYRLSFLQGNFITLTNVSDEDVERIIRYHLEPVNISFQTTNPVLRCKMLNNRFAGDALKIVDRLFEGNIEMNGQIVLCKGLNDGEELERSITDLLKYAPLLQSVSVVPVGLSKHREGLSELKPFEKEDAKQVIELIHKWQMIANEKFGYHFIHASDEWYYLAGEPFPDAVTYDGYLQMGNGVGMVRTFIEEAKDEVAKLLKLGHQYSFHKKITFVTGEFMKDTIQELLDYISTYYKIEGYEVRAVKNDYFGHEITVAGLLTGTDIVNQLNSSVNGDIIYLPDSLLRNGESILLDNMTLDEMQKALQVPIDIVKSSGCDFVDILLGYRS